MHHHDDDDSIPTTPIVASKHTTHTHVTPRDRRGRKKANREDDQIS